MFFGATVEQNSFSAAPPKQARNRSISGRFPVNFRSISGRFPVDFRSISDRFRVDFRNHPPEAAHKTSSDRVLWRDLRCPTSWVSAQHQMFYTSIRPHRFVTGRSNNHCCTIPKSSDSVSVLVFDMVASSSGSLFGTSARQK